MIQQNYSVSFKINRDDMTFMIEQDTIMQDFDTIALNALYYPVVYYDILSDFDITVDGIVCNFYKGNAGFSNSILRIQQILELASPLTYLCQEFRVDVLQSTGKIILKRIDNAFFNITIPDDKLRFFGNLQWDPVFSAYVSQDICQITKPLLILIRCNAVQNQNPDFGFRDVLYQFSCDPIQSYSYFVNDKIDITQNGKDYPNKVKKLEFTIVDQDGNPIILENDQNIYMRINFYHYRVNYIDRQLDALTQIRNLLLLGQQKKQDKNSQQLLSQLGSQPF